MTQPKTIRKASGVDRRLVVQAGFGGPVRFDGLPCGACLIEIYEKPRLAEFDEADRELAQWRRQRQTL